MICDNCGRECRDKVNIAYILNKGACVQCYEDFMTEENAANENYDRENLREE